MDGRKSACAPRICLMFQPDDSLQPLLWWKPNCSNWSSNWYCWWFRNPANHLGCMKPYEKWKILHINWLAGFLKHQQYHFFYWYWVTTLVLTTGCDPARSKLVLYLNPSPVCCCHGRSSFGFASRCNLWEVSIQTFRSFWSQITLSWMGKKGVNRCLFMEKLWLKQQIVKNNQRVLYCSRMFKGFYSFPSEEHCVVGWEVCQWFQRI